MSNVELMKEDKDFKKVLDGVTKSILRVKFNFAITTQKKLVVPSDNCCQCISFKFVSVCFSLILILIGSCRSIQKRLVMEVNVRLYLLQI